MNSDLGHLEFTQPELQVGGPGVDGAAHQCVTEPGCFISFHSAAAPVAFQTLADFSAAWRQQVQVSAPYTHQSVQRGKGERGGGAPVLEYFAEKIYFRKISVYFLDTPTGHSWLRCIICCIARVLKEIKSIEQKPLCSRHHCRGNVNTLSRRETLFPVSMKVMSSGAHLQFQLLTRPRLEDSASLGVRSWLGHHSETLSRKQQGLVNGSFATMLASYSQRPELGFPRTQVKYWVSNHIPVHTHMCTHADTYMTI